MELSLLNKLFSREIEIDFFKKSISKDVGVYKEQIKKKGSSVVLNLIEDIPLTFTSDNLVQLCNYFIEDKLDANEIAYISDVLCLAENIQFANNNLVDYLEQMTDPEINGIFTLKSALSIVANIKN